PTIGGGPALARAVGSAPPRRERGGGLIPRLSEPPCSVPHLTADCLAIQGTGAGAPSPYGDRGRADRCRFDAPPGRVERPGEINRLGRGGPQGRQPARRSVRRQDLVRPGAARVACSAPR